MSPRALTPVSWRSANCQPATPNNRPIERGMGLKRASFNFLALVAKDASRSSSVTRLFLCLSDDATSTLSGDSDSILNWSNGFGLKTLLPLLRLELHFLAFCQLAIPRALDSGEVGEHVRRPVIGGDEAVALL